MARLLNAGFDTSVLEIPVSTGTPTLDASIIRGATGRAVKFASGAANRLEHIHGTVDARDFYWRLPLYFDGTPSVAIDICNGRTSTASQFLVSLGTDRKVSITSGVGTSAALAANTYHVLELSYRVDFGAATVTVELRVDGTVVSTRTVATAQHTDRLWIGNTNGAASGVNLYFDEVALNDDTGSEEASYPSRTAGVALLGAAVDGTLGGNWKLGTGTNPSSNGFDSVNNKPPTGTTVAGATDGSQIRNNVNDTGAPGEATFDLELASVYAPAGAVVKVFEPIAWGGAASNTAQNLGITPVNPSGSEVLKATTNTINAFPTNWHLARGGVFHSPFALGATPSVKIRKASATATGCHFCFVGGYVEWEPPIVQPVGQATETDTAPAIRPSHRATIGQAVETDTGGVITPVQTGGGQTIPVGRATETDTARPVTPAHSATIAQASESDTAPAIRPSHRAAIGQATETGTARPITPWKHGIGRASEADSARPMLQPILRRALETDTARPVVQPKFIPVAAAVETDTADSVVDVVLLGQAVETDSAAAISVIWFPLIKRAVETDTAQAVIRRLVNRAAETDTAGEVERLLIGQAVETDTARPLTVVLYLLPDVYDLTENETVVFAPTLIVGQLLEVDDLATTVPVVFRPTLQAGQSLEPAFLSLTPTVFSPGLAHAQSLAPDAGPVGSPVVFSPTIIRGQLLEPDVGGGLTPIVYEPTLAHGQELEVDTVPGPLTPTVYSPGLAHAQSLAPDTATGLLSPVVYSPSLAGSQFLEVGARVEVDEATVFSPSLQLREPSVVEVGEIVQSVVRTAV